MSRNVTAVVSDLRSGTSRIFPGKFGILLGIGNYGTENSIWEKAILDLMTEDEREEKYLAELRFFNFLRHVPRHTRPDYYLVSKLRMTVETGCTIDVLHRMYYIYADDAETITHALGPHVCRGTVTRAPVFLLTHCLRLSSWLLLCGKPPSNSLLKVAHDCGNGLHYRCAPSHVLHLCR